MSSSSTTSGSDDGRRQRNPVRASNNRNRAESGSRSGTGGTLPTRSTDLGHHVGEVAGRGAEGVSQLAVVELPADRAQDLDPRPVRRGAAGLPAPTPMDGCPVAGHAAGELVEQAGFADSGFAGDHDEPGQAARYLGQGELERRQLRRSPDEHLAARSARRLGRRTPTRPAAPVEIHAPTPPRRRYAPSSVCRSTESGEP